MRELYSVSCIGVLPFIEDLSETVQSGLVASSCMIMKSTPSASLLKRAVASAWMACCPDAAW